LDGLATDDETAHIPFRHAAESCEDLGRLCDFHLRMRGGLFA